MVNNVKVLLLLSAILAAKGLSEGKHANAVQLKTADHLSSLTKSNVKRTHMESAKISARSDVIKRQRAPGLLFAFCHLPSKQFI